MRPESAEIFIFQNIYLPKYFMPVRKFINIYHIPKYFCSSVVNINGRFTYTSFRVCFICHVPLLHKKSYGGTERGIVTYALTAAVATSVTSLHEAPRESSGRYRFRTYANNVAFREISSTVPMKYYCFLSTYI